jgi:hypothetical protein
MKIKNILADLILLLHLSISYFPLIVTSMLIYIEVLGTYQNKVYFKSFIFKYRWFILFYLFLPIHWIILKNSILTIWHNYLIPKKKNYSFSKKYFFNFITNIFKILKIDNSKINRYIFFGSIHIVWVLLLIFYYYYW